VPHQAIAAVGKLQALHRGEKCLGFQLNSLRKHLPRTRSQDIRQWIVDLVGLTQGDNVAILFHGVSLSSRGSITQFPAYSHFPSRPTHHSGRHWRGDHLPPRQAVACAVILNSARPRRSDSLHDSQSGPKG
jgi:hypothetical protein